jgi:dihydrofolate reductase
MRKVFAFIVTTLDGYYEGPNQEFDWPVVDEEFNEFAVRQLDEVDTLVFGRITYEGMASYWPTPEAQQDDPRVASMMNGLPKIVVSRTLERADWANTRLLRDDVAGEFARLKQRPGKDVAILGSSALTASLIEAGVVDEVRIMIAPVVLGAGMSLFRTAGRRIALRLADTRRFTAGNILLTYVPATE